MTFWLLDNELVRKYFYPGPNYAEWKRDGLMAISVLDAMQTPIRQGERYLFLNENGDITVSIFEGESTPLCIIHPYILRLPDAYQKQEVPMAEFYTCRKDNCPCASHVRISPTPSPEKCESGCLHENHRYKLPCPDCEAKPTNAMEEKIHIPNIENKIQKIIYNWNFKEVSKDQKFSDLRDLVRLARETK